MLITVSRQSATNGELIGAQVADRLGLQVYDRELVDEIARRLQVDPDIVHKFDEVMLSPVHSILWEWRSSLNEHVYRRYLRQALERIAAQDNAVIIGRGANFVLRGGNTLHLRLVAPLELRTAIFRATQDVSDSEAHRQLRQLDHERAQFIRTLYGHGIDDPEFYDVLLNLARFTPAMAVECIVHAAQARMANQVSTEPHALLPQHVEIMTRHRRPVRPEYVDPPRR